MTALREVWQDSTKKHPGFGGPGTSHDIDDYDFTIEAKPRVYFVTLWPKQTVTQEVASGDVIRTEHEMTIFYFEIDRKKLTLFRMHAHHIIEG